MFLKNKTAPTPLELAAQFAGAAYPCESSTYYYRVGYAEKGLRATNTPTTTISEHTRTLSVWPVYAAQRSEFYRDRQSLDMSALHFYRSGMTLCELQNSMMPSARLSPPTLLSPLNPRTAEAFHSAVFSAQMAVPNFISTLLAQRGVTTYIGRRLIDSAPDAAIPSERLGNKSYEYAKAIHSPAQNHIFVAQERRDENCDAGYITCENPFHSALHEYGHAFSNSWPLGKMSALPLFEQAYNQDLVALSNRWNPQRDYGPTLYQTSCHFTIADTGELYNGGKWHGNNDTPGGRRYNLRHFLSRHEQGELPSHTIAREEVFAELFAVKYARKERIEGFRESFTNCAAALETIIQSVALEISMPPNLPTLSVPKPQ